MFNPLGISTFALALLLINAVAAITPALLYRGDTRSPETIEKSNGFLSRAVTLGLAEDYSITPVMHVKLPRKDRRYPHDPWISTSKSWKSTYFFISVRQDGKTAWVYHIRTQGLCFRDVFAEHRAAGVPYTMGHEQEFVTASWIPWDNVEGWHIVEPDGKRTYVPKNKKHVPFLSTSISEESGRQRPNQVSL
ncbi:hypothetical protein MCOR27_000594 [Pyricularia oryzae]|uniref:Uncharacterized protein n=1 Tax=Pyricularia grisea TaxID=148305 RepID=A0ABQ8NKJ1_PYRGI|nr:hypothetical protein MCOR01_005529 [Pyricularia oryzae]KAI6298487.1 hypothetical protein MCOR33_005380 [Pyricularia grisea]KAI6257214.1 hypothetical protein MCOR19_006344 [Pyricularia oryzae]KAI6280377.1 hypothetical protein MCOR26_003793 [Pyricularia oryzae]KAI6289025.1 hypothetical protein MCOR27_000594 [Pyricularia oryzae]